MGSPYVALSNLRNDSVEFNNASAALLDLENFQMPGRFTCNPQ